MRTELNVKLATDRLTKSKQKALGPLNRKPRTQHNARTGAHPEGNPTMRASLAKSSQLQRRNKPKNVCPRGHDIQSATEENLPTAPARCEGTSGGDQRALLRKLRKPAAPKDAASRRPLLKLMRLEQHVGGSAAVLAADRRRPPLGCMIPERPVRGSAAAKPVARLRRPDATGERLVQQQGPGGYRSRNEVEAHPKPQSDTPTPGPDPQCNNEVRSPRYRATARGTTLAFYLLH